MAIGGISGYSGSTMGAKATDLFGDNSSSVDNIFAANVAATSTLTVDTSEIITKGLQDQIDRLQGFRTNLSVAEKQQLAKYQQKIADINDTASGRILTADEIADRADAYLASYEILGKEYKDFTNDTFMTTKSAELDDLIATKPRGAEAKRLERLQSVYDHLMASANDRETDPPESLITQIRTVNRQIAQLTAPRPISSLSREELRQHDALVTEINDHAGYELELNSKKKLQIERLQNTIEQMQSGTTGGLFA